MRLRIIAPGGYHDRYGNSYRTGQVVDFSDDLATKLLNHNIAVPAPPPEPETVTKAPAENTAKRVHKPVKARKEEEDRAAEEEVPE
jgi:hypothetical protein